MFSFARRLSWKEAALWLQDQDSVAHTEAWRTLLEDFDLHEGSQAEFCRLHGISHGSLFYWRRKLRQTAFVEIEAPVSAACWDVELEFGDGMVLRLRRPGC